MRYPISLSFYELAAVVYVERSQRKGRATRMRSGVLTIRRDRMPPTARLERRVRLRRRAAAGDASGGAPEPAGRSVPGSPISRNNWSPQ
jgi:hypothetical protein